MLKIHMRLFEDSLFYEIGCIKNVHIINRDMQIERMFA